MPTETNAEFLVRMQQKAYTKMIFLAVQVDMPDLKRLIQQAERVQELEAYCSKSANFINQVELEKENTRLREALEQLQEDISRHGKHGGNIPRDTSFEIRVQIDEALKGESE